MRWARAKAHKGADAGGWCGQLVLDLAATDREVATLLASLWSQPPLAWADARARTQALRSARGVLLRQVGKPKPRPISAPSIPRRVRTAAAARQARPLASAFCRARGQLGLCGSAELSAYAILPRLMLQLGGTTNSADLEASYQNFHRTSLLRGVRDAVLDDAAVCRPEAARALVELAGDAVFDGEGLQRTCTTFPSGAVRTSHALCQGCSSSPTLEAIALAASSPLLSAIPPRDREGTVRLGAHDD